MVPIELADEICFEELPDPKLELTCSHPNLATDSSNLILRAAELLRSQHSQKWGARMHLNKRIPIGAGLGGGSSNGSTTLIGLSRLWNLSYDESTLERYATEFGSDTAFFIRNRPALSEGRGELLTPVDFPFSLPLLLMNFGFGSSTAWAYRHYRPPISSPTHHPKNKELAQSLPVLVPPPRQASESQSLQDSLFQNDLEVPVFYKFPILSITKKFLLDQKEVQAAMMCGSGSTMAAFLHSDSEGPLLKSKLIQKFGSDIWIWQGRTIPSTGRPSKSPLRTGPDQPVPLSR